MIYKFHGYYDGKNLFGAHVFRLVLKNRIIHNRIIIIESSANFIEKNLYELHLSNIDQLAAMGHIKGDLESFAIISKIGYQNIP